MMSELDTLAHRGIALSGLIQASELVNRLATHGQVPESAFLVMRDSLFKFEVERVEDIYLSQENLNDINANVVSLPEALRQNLHTGIRVYQQVFADGNSVEYAHTIRYFMALIQLEKHFRKNHEMQTQVKTSLQGIQNQIASDADLNKSISDLYVESLAKLPFRIQVLGKMQFLQNRDTEHKVRVLLFAGLRAAMLWHQNGGRRWHFLFGKNGIKRSLSLIKNT